MSAVDRDASGTTAPTSAIAGCVVLSVAGLWIAHRSVVGVLLGGCAIALIALAVVDIRSHRLPNMATVSLALTGLVASPVLAWTGALGSAWTSLGGGLLFGAVGVAEAWPRDGLGGGDAKLLAAVGVWTGLLGWAALLPLLLGLHVAMIAALLIGRVRSPGRRVVLGPAIAIGAVGGWVLLGVFT